MDTNNIQKFLPGAFKIRKALFIDLEDVRKVSKDAYGDYDNIPALFSIWLQNKMIHLYILTHFDGVVSEHFLRILI